MKSLAASLDFGSLSGFGPLGLEGRDASGALGIFSNFISSAIGLMTIIAIIWFVFTFITGAISMIGAGGDKAAVENARKRITNGLIGLVVTIIAVFIINLIGYLLGFKNILDIGALFGTFSK